MAYYYVKNGGTATGDAGRYATQQTGSFATLGSAGYYDNITDALAATTSPVSYDFVNVSDLHNASTAIQISWVGLSPTPFFIVCVDDTNIDASRTSGNRGADSTTGTADTRYQSLNAHGMSFSVGDDHRFLKQNTFTDCLFSLPNSGSAVSGGTDGSATSLVNCEINTSFSNNYLQFLSGAVFTMIGGAITTSSAGINDLMWRSAGNGGFTASFTGVDLTSVTGNLLGEFGSSADNDDAINVKFDMCKIAPGVVLVEESFRAENAHRVIFTRCSDSSAAAEYQYHVTAFGGDADDDSAIFRNEDEAFTESNQKISYKIVTNSDACLGSPLWFDFPVLRYSELSAAATDTLRFYIASSTVLTNKDIYIEISYPDGTNKQTPNFLTSAPATVGGTLDLMVAGTTLTTDAASTWTGGSTNKYQIDLNTSVDAGADCLPIVKVYITKPSVTIQIASEFGLS